MRTTDTSTIRPLSTGFQPMPDVFLKWQCDERQSMFAALQRGEHPRFMAAHLPVVSTLNGPRAAFPIHSSTKGVGLLPKQEYLGERLAHITSCLQRCKNRSLLDSLDERIEATLSLYARPAQIDPYVFGGIEIFRGRTYRTLLRDGRATLLFTGQGPRYLSYQFNCAATLVGPDDPRFLFLRGMRLLFERESFHIQQPEYPLGYLFEIHEVVEKTPHPLGSDGACRRSRIGSPQGDITS